MTGFIAILTVVAAATFGGYVRGIVDHPDAGMLTWAATIANGLAAAMGLWFMLRRRRPLASI
jgi:hypothetical protein